MSLLDVRGAPHLFYALTDNSIAIVDADRPGDVRHIVAGDSERFVDIAQSPSGDRVAVLVDPGEGAPAEVVMLDRLGNELSRWTDLPGTVAMATPAVDASGGHVPGGSISWSADGRHLLTTLGGVSLVSIDVGGEARELPLPDRVGELLDAGWSPLGDKIAVLARDADSRGAVWVFKPNVDGESLRRVVPPNADASGLGSVTSFGWLPNGSGLVYVLAAEPGTGIPGGELHSIDLKTGIKLVIATSGRVGPAAVIVDFAVSPDGRSVAYTIATPVGDTWAFDSLWIRSLKTSSIEAVPVHGADRLTGIWWLSTGIAWEQGAADGEQIVMQDADGSGQVALVTSSQLVATPVLGTPIASPVPGTPDAASPTAATPVVGTPVLPSPVPGSPEPATPTVGTPVVATPDTGTPLAATPLVPGAVGTPEPAIPVTSTPAMDTPDAGTPVAGTPVPASPVASPPQ